MRRPGLHWSNSGQVDPGSRWRLVAGHFGAAVVLTVSPAVDASWVRSQLERGGGLVVYRIYEPAGDLAAPADVWARHEGWIGGVDPAGYYQVLNEPDREYAKLSPGGFAEWWLRFAEIARAARPGIRLGFPAPSVGCEEDYLGAAELAVESADFIGERGYWELGADMFSPFFGWRWTRSRQFGKPIILTEFGNSDPGTDKRVKASRYVDYCATLPRCVVPAGAFISAGGDPWWDSEAAGRLWIDDAMAAAIGNLDGQRLNGVGESDVRRFSALIVSGAKKYGHKPSLVAGLIDCESGGDPRATSPDNGPGLGHAIGLMQVLQGNFSPGEDGYDPATNIEVGCRMLAEKTAAFGGRVESGLAAYFGAVDSAGNPTDATDVTGTSGKKYVAEVEGAAGLFVDLDGASSASVGAAASSISSSKVDPDFSQYAPKTGTWREACENLKGVADKALGSGRELVSIAKKAAGEVESTWGGQ